MRSTQPRSERQKPDEHFQVPGSHVLVPQSCTRSHVYSLSYKIPPLSTNSLSRSRLTHVPSRVHHIDVMIFQHLYIFYIYFIYGHYFLLHFIIIFFSHNLNHLPSHCKIIRALFPVSRTQESSSNSRKKADKRTTYIASRLRCISFAHFSLAYLYFLFYSKKCREIFFKQIFR